MPHEPILATVIGSVETPEGARRGARVALRSSGAAARFAPLRSGARRRAAGRTAVLTQRFELRYVGGCRTTHPTPSSTALTACAERGTSSGALGSGTALFRWTRVYVAHPSAASPNTERGSLRFSSAGGAVTFGWEGVQLADGARSRGTWRVVRATGALAGLSGRAGTYTATWRRRGSFVSLVLRWNA